MVRDPTESGRAPGTDTTPSGSGPPASASRKGPGTEPMNYFDVLPDRGWILHECTFMHEHDVRWTERHLQCVWFDDRLRPGLLHTRRGEPIRVLDPGRWNLESGPDFLDAVLCVGRNRRRLRGDVEVHIRPADWRRHAHEGDPRYANVVLHLTFFPGAAPGLPDSVHQAALRDELLRRSTFTFEDIDLAAYPHEILPPAPRPCAERLQGNPALAERLLEAAGRHRIDMKTARMRAKLHACPDRARVFYEEVMAALGYKHNKAAFRRLARRVPHDDPRLRDPLVRYAVLAGSAGLLPSGEIRGDGETRLFLRRLWDLYWRTGTLPDDGAALLWRLDGVRPVNHPLRRMAAAAELFAEPGALLERIDALPTDRPRRWFRACAACFQTAPAVLYWERRAALGANPARRPLALLGPSRIAAIVTNVVVPLRLAEGRLPPGFLAFLPPEQVSAPMRRTAARLLGRDHAPGLFRRSGLRQQGLLQIHQDFCLNAREGCARCALPGNLRAASGEIATPIETSRATASS